jgi:hypothetical protein
MNFSIEDEHKERIKASMSVLRSRAESKKCGVFPLSDFDKTYRRLHFDLLRLQKLEQHSAFVSISVAIRCRCSTEKIGNFSSFNMPRLTKRVSSLDDIVWHNRLRRARA